MDKQMTDGRRQKTKDNEKKKAGGGLACSKCGCCDLRVTKTVKVGKFIRRRRECRYCGKAFYTREKIENLNR